MTSDANDVIVSSSVKEIMERFDGYVTDVLEGRILTSIKVRQACERHRRDLARSAKDPAWPYTFEPRLAARPVMFMERYMRPTKGDYDAMTLMPWEVFFIGSIFGWVRKDNHLRRFREALLEVGRGNGKSPIAGGIAAYMLTKDAERGAEIYLLANSKEQAGIIYSEVKAQIERSPQLSRRIRPTNSGLYYDRMAAWIQRRSADSKRLDGLNTHLGVFDELHVARTYQLINVIKRSGNKRRQPLMLYTSSKGQVLDGPLMDYHQLFSEAMVPGMIVEEVADLLFCYIAELDPEDNIEDTSCWIKANPSLGVLLQTETLRLDWERCKFIPQERADFINKQLNLFTDMSDASFASIDVIDRNTDSVDQAALIGTPCYCGYDLSTCEDLTSVCLIYPLADGRVAVRQHSWATRAWVDQDNGKTPYAMWSLLGDLTIVEDEIISKSVVMDWLLEQERAGEDIRLIGYDPANAVRLNQEIQAHGWQTKVVRQGPLTLNDPMHEIHEAMLRGRLVINNDPMLRWFIHNVRLRRDPSKDQVTNVWMPTKRVRKLKIDGFMAMLDAWVVWVQEGSQPEQEPGMQIYTLGGAS